MKLSILIIVVLCIVALYFANTCDGPVSSVNAQIPMEYVRTTGKQPPMTTTKTTNAQPPMSTGNSGLSM